MKMQKIRVGKMLLLAAIMLSVGHALRAQEAKETLTLNLDRALEIALSDNPIIKVAQEEIALKKVAELVARSECFRQYEPYHHGTAVQYRRPDCENG